jgi:hypothetical protein
MITDAQDEMLQVSSRRGGSGPAEAPGAQQDDR